MLRTVATGILYYNKDANFRNSINKEVAKQFDGDDNVLIKTMVNYEPNLIANFKTAIDLYKDITDPYDNVSDITEAVQGFDYFGKMAFIQVYIPFVDIVNLNSNPIICINTNDDDALPGYYLDGNNELVQILVDENFAEENLIWVISVSETEGVSTKAPQNVVNLGPPPTVEDMNFRSEKFNLSDRKEGWGNGRAELSYYVMKYSDCFSTLQPCEYAHINACRVGKKDLNKDIFFMVNFTNWPQQDIFRAGEHLGIIFYEFDRRNKFKRPVHFDVPCAAAAFYSKENPYLTEIYAKDNFNIFYTWHTFNTYGLYLPPDYYINDGGTIYFGIKQY